MRYRIIAPVILIASLLLAGEVLFGAPESRSRPTPAATDGLAPVFGPVTKLFNGADLAGWNAFFGDGSTDAAKAWSVRDGVLVCNGGPVGYLQTDLRYENFELVVEWRFDP
ncbi:MAG: 3-keto-disaccharide hydrolase, partial [Planctomycetota bacterium]